MADIKFNIGYSVDESGLNTLKNNLTELSKMSAQEYLSISKAMDIDEAKTGLESLKSTISDVQIALASATDADLGTIDVQKFQQSLEGTKTTIDTMYTSFASVGAVGKMAFTQVIQQATLFDKQVKKSSVLLEKMGKTMLNTIKWNISSSVFNQVTGSLQSAVYFAKDLDRSLTDIRIVTGASADEMARFADTATSAAKNLAASTTDYTNASLIYYQQGLSEDEVEMRTDVTLKAANVTGQDTSAVSEQLTAVWNGYKVDIEDSEMVIDKLAAVAANSASNLEELSTGISKVASAANAMGVDMDQLTSQISTIVSVTRQAPESVGTALKTIYARMGDLSVDGAEDEFGTTLGDVTSKMQTMGIQVTDDTGNLRDMGTVIEEVAAKWDTWTAAQKQAAAVAMAGTRQYNNLVALFDGWDMYTENLEVSQNSLGTLSSQNDTFMEGVDAKMAQLSNSAEGLYKQFIDGDDIIKVVEIVDKLVSSFTKFIDLAGGGKNVLLGLSGVLAQTFAPNIAEAATRSISNMNVELMNLKNEAAAEEILKGLGDSTLIANGSAIKKMAEETKGYLAIKNNLNTTEQELYEKSIAKSVQESIISEELTEQLRLKERIDSMGDKDSGRTKMETKGELQTAEENNGQLAFDLSTIPVEVEVEMNLEDAFTEDALRIQEITGELEGAIGEGINSAEVQKYVEELGDRVQSVIDNEMIFEGADDATRSGIDNEIIKLQNQIEAIQKANQDIFNGVEEKFGEESFEHSVAGLQSLEEKYSKAKDSIVEDLKGMTEGTAEYNQKMKEADEVADKLISIEKALQKASKCQDEYGKAVKKTNTNVSSLTSALLDNYHAAKELNKEDVRGAKAKADANKEIEKNKQLNLQATAVQKQYAEATVKGVAAVGQLASAFNAINGLKDVFNNDDLSGWEKSLQIMTTMSYTIPMITSAKQGLMAVQSALRLLDSQHRLEKLSDIALQEIIQANDMSEIATKEAKAIIEAKGLTLSEAQTLAKKIETAATVENTVAEGANTGVKATGLAGIVASAKAKWNEVFATNAQTVATNSETASTTLSTGAKLKAALSSAGAALHQGYLNVQLAITNGLLAPLAAGFLALATAVISTTVAALPLIAVFGVIALAVNAVKKANESYVASHQAVIDSHEELRDSLAELEEAYTRLDEARDKFESGEISRSAYIEELYQVAAAMDDEAVKLAMLTGSYEDLEEAIAAARSGEKQELLESNAEARASADSLVTNASKKSHGETLTRHNKATGEVTQVHQIDLEGIGDLPSEIEGALDEAGFKYDKLGNVQNADGSEFSAEDIDALYTVLENSDPSLLSKYSEDWMESVKESVEKRRELLAECDELVLDAFLYDNDIDAIDSTASYVDARNTLAESLAEELGITMEDAIQQADDMLAETKGSLARYAISEAGTLELNEKIQGIDKSDKTDGAYDYKSIDYVQGLLDIVGSSDTTAEAKEEAQAMIDAILATGWDPESQYFDESAIDGVGDSIAEKIGVKQQAINEGSNSNLSVMNELGGYTTSIAAGSMDDESQAGLDSLMAEMELYEEYQYHKALGQAAELNFLSQVQAMESINNSKRLQEYNDRLQDEKDIQQVKEAGIKQELDALNSKTVDDGESTYADYKEYISLLETEAELKERVESGDATKAEIERLDALQEKLDGIEFTDAEIDGFEEIAERAGELTADLAGVEDEIQSLQDQIDEDLVMEFVVEGVDALEALGDSILSSSAAMEEAAGLLSNGFDLSLEDGQRMLELYPELAASAEVAADGTIKLNEEITQSTLKMHDDILDSDTDATIEAIDLMIGELESYKIAKQAEFDLHAQALNGELENEEAFQTAHEGIQENIAAIEENVANYGMEISAKATNFGIDGENMQQEATDDTGENAATVFTGMWQMAKNVWTNIKALFGNGSSVGIMDGVSFGLGSGNSKLQDTTLVNGYTAAETNDIMSGIQMDLAGADQSIADLVVLKSSLLSAGNSRDEAYDGIGKGDGSSSGSSDSTEEPEILDYIEEEIDLYYDVDKALARLERSYSNLQKAESKLTGQALLDNLNEQLAVMKEQKAVMEEKMLIAQQEAAGIRSSLEKEGVTFDEDGTINNYSAAIQAKENEVNDLITAYNKLSAAEQESYKAVVEAAEAELEAMVDNIDRYDELMEDVIAGIEDSIQDLIDAEIEIQITKFTMAVEIELEIKNAAQTYNDFYKKVVLGLDEDDIIGNLDALIELDLGVYINGQDGIIPALTEQVNATLAELETFQATGWSEVYGDNEAQLLEDLQTYNEELMAAQIEMAELMEEAGAAYCAMMDEAAEKFAEQVAMYEYINDLMEHDKNIITMLYGEDSYAQLSTYLAKQEENNNALLDFQRQEVEVWAKIMEEAEVDSDEWLSAKEKWMESVSALNDSIESALELIIEKYQNSIYEVFDALNSSLTNGMGLDYLSEEWDLLNTKSDMYLDTINSLYEMDQLELKFTTAIDATSSLTAQQKLTDVMNEQLAILEAKDNISQYDIDRANMMYDIAVKQIALEEAQQNKSSMRLKRDANGNYSYQFVSDADAIADAQAELAEAQNDLYNLDKEAYQDNLDTMYSMYQEYVDKLTALYADQTLSDEEREAMKLLYAEQYGDMINSLTADNLAIQGNLQNSAFESLANLYDLNVEAFWDMTEKEQNILMGELVPAWDSGIQSMIDMLIEDGGLEYTFAEVFERLNEITEEYSDSLDELQENAGVNFEEIASGYDETITSAENLLSTNEDLTTSYETQLAVIQEMIEAMHQLYSESEYVGEAMLSAIAAYEAVQAANAAAKAAAEEETSNNSNNTSNTSNDSTSSNSSGGTSSSSSSTQGNGSVDVGDTVTFKSGKYYETSYGTGSTGSQQLGKSVKVSLTASTSRAKPYHITTTSGGALGWVDKDQISGFDTGGYTGDWSSNDGKMAILHEKEIVLNKADTENILLAVDSVRGIASVLDSMDESMFSEMNSLVQGLQGFTPNTMDTSEGTLEQDVKIEAVFPDVKDSNEIEKAFESLVNNASQFAHRNKK